MLKALLHRIGVLISNYLMREVEAHPLTAPADTQTLRRSLRVGDVLLVEGRARVSKPIKFLTQSTWSHAAMFVGPLPGRQEANGEPHVLVEVELIDGVCASPLSKYEGVHVRICRPINLRDDDRAALVAHVVKRIGDEYDLHHLFDLLRYLLPAPPVPSHLRRRLISIGASAPTRALCSTLLAEAFQSINYPILPIIEFATDGKSCAALHKHIVREIFHIRNTSLYVPRDFDISPYFAIVKPRIEDGFDYKELNWGEANGD